MRLKGLVVALCLLCYGVANGQYPSSYPSNATAQGVAELCARHRSCRHFGGHGGLLEGVGFSTRSPDEAVRRCCFYGKIRIVDRGVARGANGWYACIRGR